MSSLVNWLAHEERLRAGQLKSRDEARVPAAKDVVGYGVGLYGFGAALGGIIVMWAISFLVRYVNDTRSLKRLRKADAMDRDTLVASLRLRLPSGSELVALEHQLYFMDERNRALAAKVLSTNGFEITTTETYENGTRYWLMATRSTMVDRVPDELLRVARFCSSYGGRYDRWNPLL